MPLTKKKFLTLVVLLFITSSFSGCIFEDILGGTSFSLTGYEIYDDDGFPALSINFSCSGTVTVKVLGAINKLVDSDLFFKGDHNTILYLDEYKNTVTPGSYKIRAYNIDNNEIYSKSISFRGSDLEIVSCSQKWWKKDASFGSNSLFGLRMYVFNNGDIPIYPYDAQIIMDNKPSVGLILSSVIMPKESKYIECFIYRESTPNNSSFTLNLRDIDENILTIKSFTVDTTDTIQTKEFSWNYYGPHKVSIPIPEFLFNYQSNLERISHDDYSFYIFDPFDDEYIDIILEIIMSEFSGTDIQNINYIASFVQTIEYKTDSEENNSYEYPRYPVETLFDSQGDCEDKAILTVSMLYSMGYEIALLRLPNHMAVGVKLSEGEIPQYEYYIDDYYFLETTTKGKSCGFIPHEYREYNDSATIYPVSNRPLLIHKWKDGTITIYTNTDFGDFVKVKAIVENLGMISARNILIEGAFITQSGFKANYENTIISEIYPGMKKKITLSVDIPKNLISYFKTRIYLEGEIVDEKESASSFP